MSDRSNGENSLGGRHLGVDDLTEDLVVTDVCSDAEETAIALVENNVPDRDFTLVVWVSR